MKTYKLIGNWKKRIDKEILKKREIVFDDGTTKIYRGHRFFFVSGYDADFIISSFEYALGEAKRATAWAKAPNL